MTSLGSPQTRKEHRRRSNNNKEKKKPVVYTHTDILGRLRRKIKNRMTKEGEDGDE
jgi:hypothetical protein